MGAAALWAIHIADGFLSWPWLAGGFVGAAVLATAALVVDALRRRFAGREVRDEEIVQAALLTAAFFVASQIHLKLGPTSVHLLLTGLLGVALRWRVALAIPVGLLLQALLLGHGGVYALGVNACVLTVPALAAWLLFAGLHRLPCAARPWFQSCLVTLAFFVWNLTLVYSVTLLCTNRFSLSVRLEPEWADAITFHPTTLTAALLAALAVAWLERRLGNAPEFALGLLVGVLTVLLTMGLSCLVLAYGGEEPWGGVVLLTFVAHMPVAALEGVVLGFTVGFLARVRPSLLGLPLSGGRQPPEPAPVQEHAQAQGANAPRSEAGEAPATTSPETPHPAEPPTAPARR
jgi:cobalt/nickel transport system permease protein